ncbi:MAG TPA: TonB-dependent receptor [Thiotrichales bacterium]|nr:TonB-dependent receptor [Thiotrichales bacterium]
MKMKPTSRLQQAIRVALYAGIASSFVAYQPVAVAQDDDAELEKVEVTGSRIKRVDVESALPVTVISRDQIDASGQISVADVLRNTTFNSFGSYRETSGNTFQGQALVSLRGLGSSRSLILIDGRRAVLSPVTQGTGVDLNTIPLAMVERIEILSDGASAVYGSDAIGGVINIITRKDFTGTEIMAGIGRPSRPGADEEYASITTGMAGDRGSITAGVSYSRRGIVYDRDRPWSTVNFGDGENYSTTEGLSIFGNNFYRFDNGLFDTVTDEQCAAAGMYRYYDDLYTGGELCTYNYTAYSASTASLAQNSIFVNTNYDINDDTTLYTRATFAQSKSFGRYAPPPDYVYLAADDPGNIWGVDGYLYHRFQGLGPRDTTNYSNVFGMTAGVQGTFSNVEYDAGLRYDRFNFDEFGRNYLLRSTAAEYVADGTYDFINPYNNDEDVLNAMKVTINREGQFKVREVYGTVSFDMFEMASGVVTGAVGGEYRSEDFFDQYDSLSEAGMVGGSAGNSAAGKRTIRSVYGEMVIPVLENLEADVAVRWDDYSDAGSEVSPKVALRWQPLDNVVVRGSYGEGFRAPTLSDLYAKDTYSAEFARDFVNCANQGLGPDECPEAQYDTTFSSNPDLGPETSKQYSLGVVVEPIQDLSVSVDYYRIDLTDAIRGYSVQELINREFAGQDLPEGSEIIRDANGRIVEVIAGPVQNLGEIKTDGIDLNVRWQKDFYRFGQLELNGQLGYVLAYEIDGDDVVNDPGVPDKRALVGATWSKDAIEASWYINYIGSTSQYLATNEDTGNVEQMGSVDAWTTHDVQLRFYTKLDSDIAIGARNLTDEDPPLNVFESGGYDTTLYNARGRVVYLTVRQRF